MHINPSIRSRIFRLGLFVLVPAGILPAQKIREMQFAGRVNEAAMLRTVRTLVGFGNRLGGSPSGHRAAEYVRKQLSVTGLSVTVAEDPERLVYVNKSWELRVEYPRRLRSLVRHEWLSGFSPSSTKRTAPLRFLGEEGKGEVRYDSSVVLTDEFVNEERYHALVQLGAVCILSYGPGDSAMYRQSAMITELATSTENPIPMFNISYSNGRKLRDELARKTKITMRFSSATTISPGRSRTILATLKGKSDKYFIVCAHGDSDSGGPGADDNASGVAGVLELGRILSAMVKEKKIPIPEYTILFTVWGSEYSSSGAFVRSRKDELGNILGVLNYDQIGTGAIRNCVYFESNDVAHNEDLMKILQSVGEDYAGKRGFWDESTTNPSQGGTDSYVFLPEYLRHLGVSNTEIPSVTVYTAAWNAPKTLAQTLGWTSKAWKGRGDSVTIDFSHYYHSSRDIPENTTEREPFNMSSAVKAVGIALLRLAW